MLKNEAVGAYEAACILAMHHTRPRRLADAGALAIREIGGTGSTSFAVYSARECDENFLDYQATYEDRRKSGERMGRPRTGVQARHDALKILADKDRPRIEFEDAIGVLEAAKILGVFYTRVPRVAKEGKIVGRILWSDRSAGKASPKLWIFSRKSCEAHAAETKKLEAAGLKRGRPRNSAKKPNQKK